MRAVAVSVLFEGCRCLELNCCAETTQSAWLSTLSRCALFWNHLSRCAVTKMEKRVADEADGLSDQRKAVALARVRLHEQQMELALQVMLRVP